MSASGEQRPMCSFSICFGERLSLPVLRIMGGAPKLWRGEDADTMLLRGAVNAKLHLQFKVCPLFVVCSTLAVRTRVN